MDVEGDVVDVEGSRIVRRGVGGMDGRIDRIANSGRIRAKNMMTVSSSPT